MKLEQCLEGIKFMPRVYDSMKLPEISAIQATTVGKSYCTEEIKDEEALITENGVNFRTGPGTDYVSKGLLYKNDYMTVYCARGQWIYLRLRNRSRSGLPSGTNGWVHEDYVIWGKGMPLS